MRRFAVVMRRFAVVLALLTAPALPAGASTKEVVKAEIHRVFGRNAHHALRVAHCESTLKPHAVHRNRNGTRDWGVFQLNDGGTLQGLGLTTAEALNYKLNIAAAYRLFRSRGWQPWVCN